jgi:DcaP outer membrane protein
MQRNSTHFRSLTSQSALLLLFFGASTPAWAQGPSQPTTPAATPATSPTPTPPPAQAGSGSLEIYGFAQADAIADFKQNDPNWYDVVRPSKLPAFKDQFGNDGRFYLSPRQSRFGVRGEIPTDQGPVKATFEFDMFGVGADKGLTTIRLRHAFGEWKRIGGGQTNSQFMDIDVFPNILDYWGPNGMLFFRNVQLYYRVIDDAKNQVTVAIENPGASGDAGTAADRVELQNVKPRYPMPDITGSYKMSGSKGHVKVAGVIRKLSYDDLLPNDAFDLNGSTTGWGLSFSGNYKATSKDTLRLQYVFGEGIANYFNDAPVDVAAKSNPGNAVTPLVGDSLPIQGLVLYCDHTWNAKFATSAGYSRVDYDNSDLQAPDAYKSGQYVVISLISTPAKNVMFGGEFQWAHRDNKSDGFSSDDYRVQVSFKYSFSYKLGG